MNDMTDPRGGDRESDTALDTALAEQEAWIRAELGDDAAEYANYGWGTDWTDEPLTLTVATKVYGHGVLATRVLQGEPGFDVAHTFRPFGAAEPPTS